MLELDDDDDDNVGVGDAVAVQVAEGGGGGGEEEEGEEEEEDDEEETTPRVTEIPGSGSFLPAERMRRLGLPIPPMAVAAAKKASSATAAAARGTPSSTATTPSMSPTPSRTPGDEMVTVNLRDIWHRADQQESKIRRRYCILVTGIVVVSLLAIAAVLSPIIMQKKSIEDLVEMVHRLETAENEQDADRDLLAKQNGIAKVSQSGRARLQLDNTDEQLRDEDVLDEGDSRSNACRADPAAHKAFGPAWSSCLIRVWQPTNRREGDLAHYLCHASSDPGDCFVALTLMCIERHWRYVRLSSTMCNCSHSRKLKRSVWGRHDSDDEDEEEKPAKEIFFQPPRSGIESLKADITPKKTDLVPGDKRPSKDKNRVLSPEKQVVPPEWLFPFFNDMAKNERASTSREYVHSEMKEMDPTMTTSTQALKTTGDSSLDDKTPAGKAYCTQRPPSHWSCAESDWPEKPDLLGLHPLSNGFVTNYICRTRGRCFVAKSLECGSSGNWHLTPSSVVHSEDCICPH